MLLPTLLLYAPTFMRSHLFGLWHVYSFRLQNEHHGILS